MVSVAVVPEGIGEGKVVVVGGAMVMDFPLDDSGATSSSVLIFFFALSSPCLRPIRVFNFISQSRHADHFPFNGAL